MTTPTEEKLFSCAIRSALDADQLRERLDLALAACAEYRENIAAITKERDIELERATHYRDQWQKAQADSRRLDWLEETLVSLRRMDTPDMSGATVTGQLRNKVRDDSGAGGPSYVRIFHQTVRQGIDAAMQQEAAP